MRRNKEGQNVLSGARSLIRYGSFIRGDRCRLSADCPSKQRKMEGQGTTLGSTAHYRQDSKPPSASYRSPSPPNRMLLLKAQQFRRVATRLRKPSGNYLAVVALAATIRLTRQLSTTPNLKAISARGHPNIAGSATIGAAPISSRQYGTAGNTAFRHTSIEAGFPGRFMISE